MMTCQDVITTFIADYVDGQLPPATLADFEHHLDVCPSCVNYLRSYRQSIAVVRASGRIELQGVPEELVRAILETLR
jgi:anti-sigma factor RsiW